MAWVWDIGGEFYATTELPSALSRHPEIMLGMLVAILRLNNIAVRRCLTREGHVALIVSVRIPSTVLTLSRRAALTTRQSSLRPLSAASHVIHSLGPCTLPVPRAGLPAREFEAEASPSELEINGRQPLLNAGASARA